jgi:putative Holliday junction resolvase
MPEPSGAPVIPDRTRRLIILAFDFGLRRIGVAVGDTVSGTAVPRATISANAGEPDWPAIARQVSEYLPDVLVVGRPCDADGDPGQLAPATDAFAAALSRRFALPVARVDEYASSFEAADALRGQRSAGHRRRRVQRGDIDSAAAAIILQRWLTTPT